MTFSYAKKHLLIKKKERGLSTFLLALGIATAFFIPFIIKGNGYFIFFGDFNVQQIPFYQLCHDAVRNGEFGWNWNTDLGSNFIASYSFYTLGSPFFWLTVPFPNHILPYLMGPLLILKFACAAFTAYLFIRRFTRTPFAAQVGALLYAFSGFSIYNIFFNHFHEAIIVLPLLLLSLELLITENKRGVFALTVALCAVVNYFFFFGMVVFAVIYWFIRTISGAYKFRFTRFCSLIFEAVIGVMLAAFLLLPSLALVVSNSRVDDFLLGWSGIMYGKEHIYLNIIECFFFPPDIPARPVFFPFANVKWSSLGGWMPVFSMTAVLGFCLSKKKHWLKRIIYTSAFMAMVPFLNSAFYAFNSSYYARWFYMPILMMALATAITIEDKGIDWKLGFRYTAVVTAAIALVVGFFPQKIDGKTVFGLYTDAGKEENIYFPRFVTAVLIALTSLIFCRVIIYLRDHHNNVLFRRAAIGFLSLTIMVYSCVYLYQGSYHSYDQKSVMVDRLIEGKVNLPKDEHYRIDTYDCVDNTGMYLSYPTINAFHSVVSPSIMEYYDFIGEVRDVASRPGREYFSIRSLLSVKYLLNRTDGDSFIGDDGYTVMPGYEYLTTDGGYYIYENTSYIPYGFSYDYYITQKECEAYYSDSARADVMLKAIILSDEDAEKYSDGMMSYSEYNENYVEPDDYYGELYPEIFYPEDNLHPEDTEQDPFTEEITSDTTLTDEINPDTPISNTDSSDINGEDDDSSITESLDESYTQDLPQQSYPEYEGYVMSLSMSEEELMKDAAHLKESSAMSFEIDKKGFSATVARDKTTLVFFSVPYDEGWSATVNGEKAEIIKANIGFMAVQVPIGVSEIRFDYTTPNLNLGIAVSGGAAILLIIYLLSCHAYKRSHLVEDCYPEGDALIESWCMEEGESCLETETEAEEVIGILDKMPETIESIEPEGTNKYHTGFQIDTAAFEEKSTETIDNRDTKPYNNDENKKGELD